MDDVDSPNSRTPQADEAVTELQSPLLLTAAHQTPLPVESTPPTPTADADQPPPVAEPRFSPRQILFLLAQAENPLQTTLAACKAVAEHHNTRAPGTSTVRGWRQWDTFRTMHDAIKRDPQVAASFLLAWSQPAAVATWRRNLGQGARVSTDAARALASEQRLRGEGSTKAKLADLIARALEGQVNSG